MSKISIYEVVPVPKLADKLVGTSVGGDPEDITYNFTLSELLNLFIPNIPGNTLQGVLDFGNTATQNINLTGIITTTTLNVGSTANILNSNLTGQTKITGGLYDRLNSIGTAGQVLTSTGTQVEWYTIPTVIPDLQQVLTSGNTAVNNIILTGNLSANNAALLTSTISTSLTVLGTLRDGLSSVGANNQVLSSNVTGVRWVNLPVYSATSPLLYNSGTGVFSIQQANASQNGYLSSADWITFDGKQTAISLTTTGNSGASTLVGATINVPNYTLSGLGGVPQTRTLTINGVTFNLSADRTWTLATGVSSVSATTPLFSTGGANPDISIQQSSSSLDGYLSSTDWLTFNSKQPAGNYITSLTGEATAAGPGAASVILSNAAVIGKLLTGLSITGSAISSSDSILTAFGKVQNQINGLIGGVQFQGVWNAATNTPALVSSVGTQGYYYIVDVAGNTNLNGITDWQVGDWAIFNGSTWNKVDNTDLVTSVNGQIGAVSLTTDNIPEGATNLYYLDSRARAALSFAAGSGAYNSTTGVITIPTDNSQILNGAGYITLVSLSATSPLTYNNTTGAFAIQVANTTQDGYLSSTDWNTFNGKQPFLGGTGLVKSVAGVISYITDNSANWNTAYNDSIVSAAVTGTATKTLTLNQQDGGTITASWSDIDTGLTSVGVSMPSAFTVTNSPLTSNGTIAITGSGNTLQYVDGTGALQSFPSLTGYVPYTGATANVNLGIYNLTAASLIKNGGTSGQFLKADGSVDSSAYIVLGSLSATAPLSYNNTTGVFTISQSGASTNGYLSSTDWNTFNNKQATITLTTTGSSGASTLIGNTLNIPNYANLVTSVFGRIGAVVATEGDYSLTQLSDVTITTPSSGQVLKYNGTAWVNDIDTDTGITSLNGLTALTQTFAVGTSGTDFAISSVTSTHTFNLPTASVSNRGALSSADWTTFNSKEPAITAGTTLQYYRGDKTFQTLNTTVVPEGTNLYYLDSRARTAISLTTTGSSGASTYNSTTGVFNIPDYGSALSGYVPTSRQLTINGTAYDLSADRSWSVGTVTTVSFTLGASGTDLNSSVTNSTTTPAITLNVPTASAANRGALSAADWSTFNTKVGGVTATTPLFSSGGSTPNITIQQSSGSQAGYLSSTDWTTFNNKQAAGNYITSLTGEATATGPGAAAVTLDNAAVTGKILTGVNITGGTILSTDSILTGFGKLQNQVNGLIGGSIYQGTWNASTNTPTLTSSVGTAGYYYIVSVAGTTNLNGITDWQVGDWAIFNGGVWQKVDNTDSVISVNGQTGAVSLTTDNISEGVTNLYYTNTRARAALSFVAGSGAYNSSTGVITIPTNTSQLTNGANFITLASLSGTAPISYNSGTGAISITQSGTASNGYLSSTDWNTFNNKQATISLTTTGTSGAATLVGTTLNIPQYQSVLTNPVTGSGTNNRIAKFTSTGSTIGDSNITDNGATVRVSTIPLLVDSRLAIGTAGNDQNYAYFFIGGDLAVGTTQSGILLDPQLAGTSSSYAIYSNARIKASTAVANAYGLYITNAELLSGASITNNYGLYIANQTSGGTNNYALYSAGGLVYIAGLVGVNWAPSTGEQMMIGSTMAKSPSSSGWGLTVQDTNADGAVGRGGAIAFGALRSDGGRFNAGAVAASKSSAGLVEDGDLILYSSVASSLTPRIKILSPGRILMGTSLSDDSATTVQIGGLTQNAIQTMFSLKGYNASSQAKSLYFRLTAGTPLWSINTGAAGLDAGIEIKPDNNNGLLIPFGPSASSFTNGLTIGADLQLLGLNPRIDYPNGSYFRIYQTGVGTRLYIDASGTVQVGGASSNLIEFYPLAGSPRISVEGGASSSTQGIGANIRLFDNTNNRGWTTQMDASYNYSFFAYNGTAWAKVAYITQTGDVTYNGTITATNLVATTYSDSYYRFRLFYASSGAPAAELYEDGSSTNGATLTLYGKASGTVDTVISAAPTKLNYINNAANVMIGWSTDQGYKLAVNGAGYFSSDLTTAGDARVSGKMGIGDAPQSGIALYIKGNSVDSPLLKMQGFAYTTALLGDTTTGTTDVGNLWLYNQGVLNVRFDAGSVSYVLGGNFGVGTSTPAGKLTILNGVGYTPSAVGPIGGSIASRLQILGAESGIMLSSDISPTTGAQTGTQAYQLGLQIGFINVNDIRNQIYFGNAPLVFVYSGDQGVTTTPRMTINTSGDLGVGTLLPTNRFHSYAAAISVSDWNTYAGRFSNNSNKGVIIGYDDTNNRGHIGSVNPGVAWTDLVLNANGGNLGIGTTNLPFKVNIESTSETVARIKSTNASGAARLILNPEGAGAGSTGDASITFDCNTSAWVAGVDKSDSSRFKIAADPYSDFRAGVHLSIDNVTDRTNVVIGGTTALATSANRGNLTINGVSNSILAFGVSNVLKGYLYNDGLNFFWNTGAGDIYFETNTATPMVITSGGFVGIRTTPLYQFAVNGAGNGIDFETNTTSTYARSIFFTTRETGVAREISTTGGYSYGPSNPLTMVLTQTSDTPIAMFRASDDAVGAGLKGYKSRGTVALPVSVSNGDTIFSIEGWAFHGSGPNHAKFGAGMRFVKDDLWGTASAYAPQRTEFYNANSTTTLQTNMIIFPNGNTSIGSTSYFSTYKLYVGGIVASSTGFLIDSGQYTSISGVPYIGMFATEAASADGFGALLISSRTDAARPIIFGTSNGSASTERMRITSGGALCLGVTSAYGTNLLNVNGGIYATSSIAAVVAADIDMFVFQNTGASYTKSAIVASMTATGGTGSYFFYGQQSTSTVALKIFSNGNIQNTNNSYGAISDARLKENIKDATPKLDDLMKVKVRNYNLIGESNKQLGVISQELEEIFPNMIEESTNIGENVKIKGVKYSVFVPMLIKAVQELKAEIETLKNK